MQILSALRQLTPAQRDAFLAAFLGWALDAFDYFILVFVLKDVAKTFHTDKTHVALALTLTLAMRPVGALIFGWAADRYGRRLPLMLDVIFYALIEMLSGFSPTLGVFFVLRAIFGIAMGGEWGLGASLAMETIPAELRGLLSGVLQEGYSVGYLFAALLNLFVAPHLNWRWMFFLGALPALLSLFIRSRVKESPVWLEQRGRDRTTLGQQRSELTQVLRTHLPLFLSLVVLMAAFNGMSHGTQDVYPTFLQTQHHFNSNTVSAIAITYNIGAIVGGIVFGAWSQRVGRKRAIITAALLALPMVPLWAFAPNAVLLAVGAFLIQFCVQGAWGVIPAHLTELAPNAVRGVFTGLAYQLGNLIASGIQPLEIDLAEHHLHGNYGLAMAPVVVVVLLLVAGITACIREQTNIAFTPETAAEEV